MRVLNSLKNATVATIMNVIVIIVGFIAQKYFVVYLGNEYLGLNGLFNNILSILAVVELGFGTAMIYHLYRPIYDNDKVKINLLLKYYKKIYRIIAVIILFLGVSIMPFIKSIIGDVSISDNIYGLYLLALLDVVISYFLTYKRSILYANQKTYIINIVHIAYVIVLNIVEICALIVLKNYIIYLVIKIIFRMLENIIINIIVNKMYPFICKKIDAEIEDDVKKDIIQKVKGLAFHRIGGAVVLGTDNIIISYFFGVVKVGLYSNYSLIITAVTNLFGQVFSSITASVGNLLIENDLNKSYKIYNKILFANSWLYCIAATCIMCLMEPFISLWMGKDYLLPTSILIVLVVNFYLQGLRKTSAVFKEAAGIFYEDRYMPLVESIINIVSSIALAHYFGLIGVFIGTIISSLVLFIYSYPVLVYKKIFKRRYSEFIFKHMKYFLLSMCIILGSMFVVTKIYINNLIMKLFINLIISLIVTVLTYIIIFRKSEEYNYFKELIGMYLKK